MKEVNFTCGIPSTSKELKQVFKGQHTFLVPLKLYQLDSPVLSLLSPSPDTLKLSLLSAKRPGSPGPGPAPNAIWSPLEKQKRDTSCLLVIIHCNSHVTGVTSSRTYSKGTPHPHLCPHHGLLLGTYQQILFGE